jgi:hypothetical protein
MPQWTKISQSHYAHPLYAGRPAFSQIPQEKIVASGKSAKILFEEPGKVPFRPAKFLWLKSEKMARRRAGRTWGEHPLALLAASFPARIYPYAEP